MGRGLIQENGREKSLGNRMGIRDDEFCYFTVLCIASSLRLLFQQSQSVCISRNALVSIYTIYVAKSQIGSHHNFVYPAKIALRGPQVLNHTAQDHFKLGYNQVEFLYACFIWRQNSKKIVWTWHPSLMSNFVFQNNYGKKVCCSPVWQFEHWG